MESKLQIYADKFTEDHKGRVKKTICLSPFSPFRPDRSGRSSLLSPASPPITPSDLPFAALREIFSSPFLCGLCALLRLFRIVGGGLGIEAAPRLLGRENQVEGG